VRPGRGGRLALAVRDAVAGDRGRFVLAASPVLVVFVLAEWLVLTGSASFSGVLGFTGVIANSLTAWMFPALLLVASRRKGDYVPGVVYRGLGHPAFAIALCALSLATLLAHGLIIYRDPWTRLAALGVSLAVVGLVAAMLRGGAFGRRSVIELREDLREGGASVLAFTSAGQPQTATVRLGHASGEERVEAAAIALPTRLRWVGLEVPAGATRELKIWVHRVTLDGMSEARPALVEVRAGDETRHFDLALAGGHVVLPLPACGCSLRITLPAVETSADPELNPGGAGPGPAGTAPGSTRSR
jgi:hypothetical protein